MTSFEALKGQFTLQKHLFFLSHVVVVLGYFGVSCFVLEILDVEISAFSHV